MKNNEVPLWLRYALTLSVAAQYFNIGERKLQQIADENRDTGFVIYNGVKLLFKREKFAEWLNETNAIWIMTKGHWADKMKSCSNALFHSKNDKGDDWYEKW